jgi:hypothetical protein
VEKAREVKAWIIIGPGKRIHLDKLTRSPAESWGLLSDELHAVENVPRRIVEYRRLGYECRRAHVHVAPVETKD